MDGMQPQIRGAVLTGPGQVDIRSLARPIVGPRDVMVAPRVVGICGSDLHLYRRGRIGTSVVAQPLVLGHESAGSVVEVGVEVERVRPGDRVVIEPGIACGACWWCQRGEYNICPNVRFLGIPPSDGTMAELVVVPERFVHPMPDAMSWADGAMIEPFAIGLQAVKSAGIATGDSVVVLGSGPIGLMIAQAARIQGATEIIVVDIAERPLAIARQLGATATLDGRRPDLAEAVADLTDRRGADHVVEAVGASATVQRAVELVRRGGTITLVGIAEAPGIPMDTIRLVRTGLTVRTTFRYAHVHPAAIALAASGRADLRTFVTHRFDFDRVADAFREIGENKGDVVKAIVELAT